MKKAAERVGNIGMIDGFGRTIDYLRISVTDRCNLRCVYCMKEEQQEFLPSGELLTLACALCFAIHILVIDHFSSRVDGVKLSCIQFAVCAVLAWVAAFLWESPSLNAIVQCWLPIGYAGILSSGVAFTLQIVAQKYTKPAVASLLMSLESFFAVLFGAVLLQERLSLREYAGCILMFGAFVLAQLPAHNKQAQ